MALRTAQPRKPKRPIPTGRTATAAPNTKGAFQSALTNLATISGGTPPGGGAGGAGGQQDPNTPAWESDPILQQIKAYQASNIAAADAQAHAARQQALINFGYSAQLGALYGDQGTKGAAEANPFSILKELENNHNLRQKNLNENLNKANLFYSSTRGQQLGQEGKQYLGEQYGAGQRLQSQLSELANADLAAHQAGQGAINQAQQDAYERYLNQQLQYGLGSTAPTAPRQAVAAAPIRRPRWRP